MSAFSKRCVIRARCRCASRELVDSDTPCVKCVGFVLWHPDDDPDGNDLRVLIELRARAAALSVCNVDNGVVVASYGRQILGRGTRHTTAVLDLAASNPVLAVFPRTSGGPLWVCRYATGLVLSMDSWCEIVLWDLRGPVATWGAVWRLSKGGRADSFGVQPRLVGWFGTGYGFAALAPEYVTQPFFQPAEVLLWRLESPLRRPLIAIWAAERRKRHPVRESLTHAEGSMHLVTDKHAGETNALRLVWTQSPRALVATVLLQLS